MDLQTSNNFSTLQLRDYVFVSLAVFWVYDCFLTLDQEIYLIHGLPWKKGSILYVMTRYSPAFLLCVHLYMNHVQNEHFMTCTSLHSVWYEGIFVLRTYVLWGRKKSIMGLILATLLCLVILDVVMTTTISNQLELQPSDMGWGCYSPTDTKMTAAPWTLLVAFELEIIALTMIRVYRAYRERGCLLLDVLLQHSIFYFGTGLTLSVVNILSIVCLPYDSSNIVATFQIIMHSIVVTRMHLQFCGTPQVGGSSESGITPHSQLTHIELETSLHSNA
ncbi:uncharacterized protein EDB91DRAFT_553709 [Suillus paluster]|uniref:uncharacterized protein n=1 Tax=Suillus paluster TaxID=48578 RepID=UPI001B87CBBC|nr:uncharacterized protein EDB91DRAFT_553709 [Suillus paluster]KAG1735576.1 hypothetical protein EDB91DRAFT_553709 [Suillus paluster]